MKVLEDFSFDGTWWLPEDPEDVHHGTLTFKHHDHIFLKILGLFKERRTNFYGPEIILGRTNTNENITLLKTAEISYKKIMTEDDDASKSLGSSTFICYYILLGDHFNKADMINFHSLDISYTNLEQWISPIGIFKTDLSEGDYSITVKQQEKYAVDINGKNFKLWLYSHISDNGNGWTKMELNYISYFRIEPNVPKDIEWYEDLISNLQTLLTLLIGTPVYTKSLIAEGLSVNQFGMRKRIKIYRVLTNPHIISELYPFQLRSSFSELIAFQSKDYFKLIVNNWFEKIEIFRPVYELIGTNYYNPSMYLHIRFQTWLQGIEAFHRRACYGKYISDDNYKPICKQLEAAIPTTIESGFRESLKSRIKYGNEFSLRTRLRLIWDREPLSWFKLIMGKPNKKIINRIVENRNYLTHYDESNKKEIFTENELHNINRKLEALITIMLLEELGAPTKLLFKIAELSSGNESYKRFFSK